MIPKPLREHVGIVPGEVEITIEGAGLHIEPVASDELGEEDGRPVIPAAGRRLDDEDVRALRNAGRR